MLGRILGGLKERNDNPKKISIRGCGPNLFFEMKFESTHSGKISVSPSKTIVSFIVNFKQLGC